MYRLKASRWISLFAQNVSFRAKRPCLSPLVLMICPKPFSALMLPSRFLVTEEAAWLVLGLANCGVFVETFCPELKTESLGQLERPESQD